MPTWVRWLIRTVLVAIVVGLVVLFALTVADDETRNLRDLSSPAALLGIALLMIAERAWPVWLGHRQDRRAERGELREIYARRSELTDEIAVIEAEFAREGAPAEGSARHGRLSRRLEESDYLDSLVAQKEVLSRAPRGAMSAEPSEPPLTEPAVEELRALLDRSSRITAELSGEDWFLRGNAAVEAQRYEEALAAYDRAIELGPNNSAAHSNRGVALGRLGRQEEALHSYERAIDLRPGYPEAHANRGSALGELRRYDEALAASDRAIDLRPGYPEAHYNRAVALDMLGAHDEALAASDRAIKLRPDYPEAHNTRGVVLGELGRHQEALAAFERAIDLRPDFPVARDNRRRALNMLERRE